MKIIQISLKFVPKGPIDNKPALVQIMAWHWTQAIIWTNDRLGNWRIYALLGLNELKTNLPLVPHICESSQHWFS